MLTLEEAQAKLLALAPELPKQTLPIESAAGRYLTGDLIARRTQPPSDLSAMDGFSVSGPGPWTIVGESRAGHPFHGSLAGGQAIRISTGAAVPENATGILLKEDSRLSGTSLADSDQASARHIRPHGFDFVQGDTLLAAGSRLGPAQIALALSAGHDRLEVRRPPTVAIIDSGDELASDPTQVESHQIPASNGAMIAAMLSELGCSTMRLGPVPDDLTALADALKKAESADLVISSGGASVGDHDLVQEALRRWGAELSFWKAAIKPGKPLMVASREGQVILGLPGNPVSSFVTCFLFAQPLVRAAMGDSDPLPRSQEYVCEEALPAVGKRREFLRGICDGKSVRLAVSQDSSGLRALASANCLIDRLAGSPELEPGSTVSVYRLRNG